MNVTVKALPHTIVNAPVARLAQQQQWRQQGGATWLAAHAATLWKPRPGPRHTTCPAGSPPALLDLPELPASMPALSLIVDLPLPA